MKSAIPPALAVALSLSLLTADVEAQGLGVRVTPEGLDAVAALAIGFLPNEISTGEFDTTVFDCPASTRQVSGHLDPTDIDLNFDRVELRAEDGAFVVGVTIDVGVATQIYLNNPYACFGEATCDVSAQLDNFSADITLAASSGPEGGIEFHGAMVDLGLTAEDLNMESEGCAVGEVVTWLVDTFEDWALEMGIPRLESALSERVSMMLTDIMDETLALQVEQFGLRIAGTLNSVDLDRSTGLTAGGDVELEWTADTVWDQEAPATAEAEGEALPADFGPGMFQLAIADRVVTRALYEAWRGGMLQRFLANPLTRIELGGDGIVQQLGLEDGTALQVWMDIEEPIEVRFGRDGADVARLVMRGMHVRVDTEAPSGAASSIDVRVDASVDAKLAVSEELGGLVLEVGRMEMDSLQLASGETNLDVDRAQMGAFMTNTVRPMLGDMLAGVPVAPSLNSVLGMFLNVRSLSSEGGWQRVGLDVVAVDAGDNSPPDTFLETAPTRIGAGTATFSPTGTDDTTPEGLLRYRAWLDGEPVGDGMPSGLREVHVDVTDGTHSVEIAAVDLNGNEDPTPVEHTFEVDGQPPVLTILEAPLSVLDGDVVARWEASDDDGAPVQSRWEIRRVGEDANTRVAGTEFATDVFDMRYGIDGADLYELEIVVRDTAGNVTSQTFGFAQNPGGGCSVSTAPGHGQSGAGVLLLIATLFGVRRRFGR